jgi:hypothetical protein
VAPIVKLWRYHQRAVLYTTLIVQFTALGLGLWSYTDRRAIRSENRHAIILIARSSCDANDAFKRVALRDAKTKRERQRIEDFFTDFEAPLNRALTTLGASGCQG